MCDYGKCTPGKKEERNMGRIKVKIFALLLVTTVFLTACGGQKDASGEGGKRAKEDVSKAVQETDKETKDGETSERIPDDLLPSQEDGEEAAGSDTMEIVEADGTVRKIEKSGTAGSGSGKQNVGKKDGSHSDSSSSGDSKTESSGGSENEQKTMDISFVIDSSNADGSVSYSAVMTLDAGATVYDALEASGVSHSGKSYVTAIGGLSEKMFGPQSGWKYYVNGSVPNKSCTDYVLKNGDSVQWSYVLKP